MFAVVLALAISRPALALDVERSMQDGWMVVSAVMAHPHDRVNAVLAKPGETMRLGRGVRSVEVVPGRNGGARLTVRNRGFARDHSYTAERCPVEHGWHSRMIDSEDFEDHQIIWTTKPEGQGSRVTIRVKVQLHVPVPGFLVRQVVGGALEDTLEKMDVLLRAE